MQASLRNPSQGPHLPKPILCAQISLPNSMKREVVRRNMFSIHIIFIYIHVSSDSRHSNYWEQGRGLVKKKNPWWIWLFWKKSKSATQALQPLAELQIPQIFTKPFIPLMAYLITFLSHFMLERKRKEGLVLPTENTFVNSAIVLCNTIYLKMQTGFHPCASPALNTPEVTTDRGGR